MKNTKSLLLLLCFFTGTGLTQSFGQSKISDIKAKLFYNEKTDGSEKDASGGFSANILDDGMALWNTIIGAGDAEGASTQTAVIVEVSSKGMSNKLQAVKLTSIMGKKTLIQQQSFTCVDCASYKLLFLLNNTGCEKVSLKAELIQNSKSISQLKKSINFKCGE